MGAAFSVEGLGQVREVMARYVDRGALPGLVYAVARRGEVHVETIGAVAFGRAAPMQADSIFRISSMTKPVVAAAALMLVEECRLRLDDPVDDLLPELADRRVLTSLDASLDDTVPANRPITVRDLLTFRLGFGIVLAPPDTYPIQRAMDELRLSQGPPNPDVPPAPDEWIRNFGQVPLMHQPGEEWRYSTGADVLGVLVARATGQDLETFMGERIFAPLGMHDTSFSVPADRLDRFTTSYVPNPATGEVDVYDPPADGQWSHPPAFPSGAGGLVSTLDDYLRFSHMMLAKGTHDGRRLLAPQTVETMATNQLTADQSHGPHRILLGANRGWGLGMSVVTSRDDISASVGAYGWDGGMGTSWRADPAHDLEGVLLTQLMWSTQEAANVVADFWTTVYAALD